MADVVRARYGGSKTRTGCVTCKARRVKCDERKPGCARCEKAGRACEGYRSPMPRSRRSQLTIVSYVPTADGSLSAQPATAWWEQRALAFFQHETAPEFSGVFSSELWSRFMLLVAHHQSSVKHALVALGALHERFVTTNDTFRQGLTLEYALQHYNKAINEVVAIRDTKREDAAEIALVSCILFSCLESLRGYFQSAITHLLSGIRIMHDLQKSSGPSGHHAYIPQAIIRALFLHMDSQIMNIAGPNVAAGIPLASEVDLCLPVCYASPDDAMADLTIIYNLGTHLLCQAEMVVRDHGAGHPTLDELKQQRARYQHIRIRWQEAFQAMLLNNATGLHSRDPRCMILNVQNNALGIILNVSFIDPEMDFDQFADVFRGIVDDAEEIIFRTSVIIPSTAPSRSASRSASPSIIHPNLLTATGGSPPAAPSSSSSSSSSHRSPLPAASTPSEKTPRFGTSTASIAPRGPARIAPSFSLAMGVVSVLWLAAARCRSAPIRHKAISLLKSCNRREGMWDSRIAAEIAEKLVAVEEAVNMQQQQQQPSSDGDGDDDVVVVQDDILRVKAVEVTFGPESTGAARYSFMDSVEAYMERDQRGVQAFNELMTWDVL